MLSAAQVEKRHARLVARLAATVGAGHAVPCELHGMHRQACQSICSIATELQRCSNAPQMHTYINAYFLWNAWLQAMCTAASLREGDPKHASVNLFKQLSLRKVAVVIPAVCFWLSVKCTETWTISVNDLACMIDAVEHGREDYTLGDYTLPELCQAEDGVLRLLDWDLLAKQKKIDGMEDMLEAHFEDSYSSAKVQSEVVLLIFRTFTDVRA